jgi:hypothetical protein
MMGGLNEIIQGSLDIGTLGFMLSAIHGLAEVPVPAIM